MRVAEIVSIYPPLHGGMGYVCHHNARLLAQRGHDVTVFTLDHGVPQGWVDSPGFGVVRLRATLLHGDGGVVPSLYRRISGFDAIHLHYPFYGGGEYVWLASVLRGQRYLLTYHMDVHGNTPFKRAAIGFYEPLLGRRILRRAFRVGAVSRAHIESSRAAGVVPPERVVEIPNGVDTERFQPRTKDHDLMERYGLAGKTVALFVGNLQPFKRLDLLIEAIAAIDNPNLVLMVVGGGYGEDRYKAQVRDLGIGHRVVFAGPKNPEEDLPAHYALGDFLVLPSTHSESFGLVVLEAMASGKPVVVSSLPGPAALVDDGRDGLISRLGDVEDMRTKIASLARDIPMREKMGKRAREKTVEKYRWERIGEILEGVLRDILTG
ncbi:MAG: glycosyltransferase family 4 protein [Deltaproteobacteria bacterium]|nr:glycosyltransferase family 4 protein [Candidatus Deferrimicrobium borealis]